MAPQDEVAPQDKTPQDPGVCCFYLRFGKCEPPRPPCRFRHDVEQDDGVSPCCFGATCRLGHAKRIRAASNTASVEEKEEYWRAYNANDATVGGSPAVRDATLLRSQLEPWPTAVLRERLVTCFGQDHRELDPLGRAEIMPRLLEHYQSSERPRKTIRVLGTPVREDLRTDLLVELRKWSEHHTVNMRPSINAQSYMILRSPKEFGAKDSNKARLAAKKIEQNMRLWELAHAAISEVDAEFAGTFSALAVTKGFTGSPHIDKQNTGPFYGMALGDFPDDSGGVCVEASAFAVAHVNTKNRLGKVDGRFPHWVAPYDATTERYSLIYYSTWQTYSQPTTAFYGKPEEGDEASAA